MRVGSLFAGIGGMDLGLERAGMEIAWQVEIDPYCRRVLEKHWPGVERHDDIRTFEGWNAELICGGFPCTDISHVRSGERAGLHGEQSGLWNEMLRVVRRTRPRWVLLENSCSLTVRGLAEITGSLSDIGYCSEWTPLPAAAFGANHLRARVWILAHAGRIRNGMETQTIFAGWHFPQHDSWWATEPGICRVDDGVPARVDRLRALGNAVVPQVVEWIGRRIMEMR